MEVSKQIQPLHEWMLGFWSNGSGRPPGFFQMRIKADDDRFERLRKETETQSEVLKRLDANMQEIAAQKKAEDERKERMAKRIAFWLPILRLVGSGILAVLLALVGWLGPKAVRIVDVLWEDYMKAHPITEQKIKNISRGDSDPVYSREHNPIESAVEPH